MAKQEGVRFLGSLPVDTELVTLLDAAEADASQDTDHDAGGFALVERYQKTSTAPLFKKMAEEVVRLLVEDNGEA